MELGVYIREAMEEAGKPFGELSPEQVGAVLRKYETARSHRVAHIVGKSGMMGNMFMIMGYLVSHCLKPQAECVLSREWLLPPLPLYTYRQRTADPHWSQRGAR